MISVFSVFSWHHGDTGFFFFHFVTWIQVNDWYCYCVFISVYLCYQRAFLKWPQELRIINGAREGLLLKVWNKWHQQSLNTAINGMTFFFWPWGRRRCESAGSHPHTDSPLLLGWKFRQMTTAHDETSLDVFWLVFTMSVTLRHWTR